MDQALYDPLAEARRLAGDRLRISEDSRPVGRDARGAQIFVRCWNVYRLVGGRPVYIGRRSEPGALLSFVKRLLR